MKKYILTPWMEGVLKIIEGNLGLGLPTKMLLEGPPGASKTSFAQYIAGRMDAKCFEFNFRSSMKAEDVLYEIAVKPGNQITYVPSPLWEAFEASKDGLVVLLLDEIDKARDRAEELLLRTLEQYRFRDPFGEFVEGLPQNLIVVATSNRKRELMEPTLRRFPIRLQVSFPDIPTQMDIVRATLPDGFQVSEKAINLVVRVAQDLRLADPNKAPSYYELGQLLVYARALCDAGVDINTFREILQGTLWKNGAAPKLSFNWAKALLKEIAGE